MSGLGALGGLIGFSGLGQQVSPGDIDQYEFVNIDNPAVDVAWHGAGTSTGTTAAAIVLKNQLCDWPRNLVYQTTGGTTGGTFTANLIDQFGNVVTEKVVVGTAAAGGSVFGTAIAFKFLSGTVQPIANNQGTYTVGYGTVENGSASSNWFGLMTKIGGTTDVKNIRWSNNGTAVGLNKGTAIGTLVDATRSAFQGTSGVALTDTYTVTLDSTFDNSSFGKQAGL